MTKSVLVALALVSFVPVTAQGATVIVPAPAARMDDFSMPVLVDGVDHVLASVDDRPPPIADPFGGGAAAFASADIAARGVGVAMRDMTANGTADPAREPLPEPATWLMMILGFFGLSFAVRRRSIGTGDRVRFS